MQWTSGSGSEEAVRACAMVVPYLLIVMLVHILVSADVSFSPGGGLEFGILTAMSENRTLPVHIHNDGLDDVRLVSIVPKETNNGLVVNMTDDMIIKFGDNQTLVAHVTCTALTPGRKSGKLVITTKFSNGTLAIHEMAYSLSVLHGGIGFEKTQFIFYIPIKNTTCNEDATSPLLTRQVYFSNYFQVPISLQMISSATCGDLIYIDPSSIPQGAVNSLEKWSAINVTYDVNLASRKSNELLPFTCWLEVWTTISSHRIPIHLVDGALKLAFIDAQMVDEPNSMSSAGLDFIKSDKYTKLCGQSDESQIESNNDVYNIKMQTQSRDEPKPLRLAFTNKNPTKFDLSIVKASCDLCLCFEFSWADVSDDDDSALYYMSRVTDLSLEDARADITGRCSCTPSKTKAKNYNSTSNYITKLKMRHTSLFTVIFSGRSASFEDKTPIIAFTLGSLNQRIHAIIHLDFTDSKMISTVKSLQREVFIGMDSNTVVKTVIPSVEQSLNSLVTKSTSSYTIVTDSFVDHHNRILFTSLAPNISCFKPDRVATSNIWSCTQELIERQCQFYPDEYCNSIIKRLQIISGYMESKQIVKFLRERNALIAYDTPLLDLRSKGDVTNLFVYSSFSLHRYSIPATITKSPIKYIPILSSARLPIISIDEIAIFYIQLYNPYARALTLMLKDYTIMPSTQTDQSIVSAITIMPSLWASAFSEIIDSFDGDLLNATYTESPLSQNDSGKPDLKIFKGIRYQKYSLSGAQFHQIRSSIVLGNSVVTPFIVNSMAMNDIVIVPRSSAAIGPFAFVPNIVLYRNKLADGGIVTPDEFTRPIEKALDGTPNFVCHFLNFHLVNNFTGADMIEISGESGTANLIMTSALVREANHSDKEKSNIIRKANHRNFVHFKIDSNNATEAWFSVLNNGSISAVIEDIVVNERRNYSCIQNKFLKFIHLMLSPSFDLNRNDVFCSLANTFPIRINSNDIFNLTLPLPQSNCKYYEIHDKINIVTSMGIALDFVVISHFSKEITDDCQRKIGFNAKSLDSKDAALYLLLLLISVLSFIQLKILIPHLVFKTNVPVIETGNNITITKSKQMKKKKKEITKDGDGVDDANNLLINLEKSLTTSSGEEDNTVLEIPVLNSSSDERANDNLQSTQYYTNEVTSNTSLTQNDETAVTNDTNLRKPASDTVSVTEVSKLHISSEPVAKIDDTTEFQILQKIESFQNNLIKTVHDKTLLESSKTLSSLMLQEQKWSPTRISSLRQENTQQTKSTSIPKGTAWNRIGSKESQGKEATRSLKYTLLQRPKSPASTILPADDNKTTPLTVEEVTNPNRSHFPPAPHQNHSNIFNNPQFSLISQDITRSNEISSMKGNEDIQNNISRVSNTFNNAFKRFPSLSHSENVSTLAPPPGLSLPPPGLSLPPGFDIPSQSQIVSLPQDHSFNMFTGSNALNLSENNLQNYSNLSTQIQMSIKNDLMNTSSFASIDGHLESWMDELLED